VRHNQNQFIAQIIPIIFASRIPLPGELTGGIPARFDRYGVLFQPKRIYKKKISPQCPFCDKRYKNEYSLKKHITKKHPDCTEWVQCLKCFKALPSKEDLPTHLCEMVSEYNCNPIHFMDGSPKL
jgi:hypothetical protein